MVSRSNKVGLVLTGLLIGFFIFLYRGLFVSSMLSFGDLRAFTPSWYSVERYVSAWQPEGLGNNEARPIIEFVVGMMLAFTDQGWLIQRLVLFSLLPLALLTMWAFLALVTGSRLGKVIGAFLYSVNPLTLQEFSNGSVGMLMVYSIQPIIALSFVRSVLHGKKEEYLVFGLSMSVASLFYPHASLFVVLPVILVFALVCLIQAPKCNVSRRRIGYAMLLGMGIYLLLLLPSVIDLIQDYLARASALPNLVASDIYYTYSRSNLGNLVRLLGVAWEGTTLDKLDYLGLNIYGLFTLAVPLLAFIGAILAAHQKNPEKLISLSCILLSVSLITFGYLTHIGLTMAAFENFPLLSQYRSPVKLMYVLAFAYAPLVANAGSYIEDLINRVRVKAAPHASFYGDFTALGLLLLIGASFVISISPFLDGTITLQKIRGGDMYLPDRYISLGGRFGELRDSVGFFRVLWLPLNYETSIKAGAVDKYAFIMPGGAEVRGQRYPSLGFFEQTLRAFADAKPDEAAKLLGLASVRYIAVDMLSNWNGSIRMLGQYYLVGDPEEFAQALTGSARFERAGQWFGFTVFENSEFIPHFQTFDVAAVVKLGNPSKQSFNLVVNGGFEEELLGWIVYPAEDVALDTTTRYEGITSVQLTNSRGDVPSLIFQRIPIISGVTYNLSVRVRTIRSSGTHVKLVWYRNPNDDQSTPLHADYEWITEDQNGEWRRVELVAEAPFNATTLEVVLITYQTIDTNSAVEVWFDDVKVVSMSDISSADSWAIINQVSDIPELGLQRTVYLNKDDLQSLGVKPDVFVYVGFLSLHDMEDSSVNAIFLLPSESLQPIHGFWLKMPGSLSQVLSSSNATAILKFSVAEGAYYSFYIDALPVDKVSIQFQGALLNVETLSKDILYLQSGNYSLIMTTLNSEVLFRNIVLFSSTNRNELFKLLSNDRVSNGLETTRQHDYKYNFQYVLEITSGRYLLFLESFDEGWVAQNGLMLKHFKYFWLNGYLLDENSSTFIMFLYQGQQMRNLLLVLQGFSWVLVLGTLAFMLMRRKIEAINLLSFKNGLLSRFPPYDPNDMWVRLNRERLVTLVTRFVDVRNKRYILDLGCAEGGFITQLLLHAKKETEAVGIDISREIFQEFGGQKRLEFIVADAAHLPFRDDVFDLVVGKDLLHHIKSANNVIHEVLRVSDKSVAIVIIEANRINMIMRLFQKYGKHQHLALVQLVNLFREGELKVLTCTIEAHPYYPFFDPSGHFFAGPMILLWDVLWLIIKVLFDHIHVLVKVALSFENIVGRIAGSTASFNFLIVRKMNKNPRGIRSSSSNVGKETYTIREDFV